MANWSFDCVVKLVENKEESLEMALSRLNKLKLKNCYIYKVGLCSNHFS